MYKLSVVIVVFFISCSSSDKNHSQYQRLETVEVDLDSSQDSLKMSEFISEINYREIVTPPNEPVGSIRKIMIQDDFIGFFDESRQCIWINSKDGEFVSKVLIPRGRGPGELERLSDVIITDNNQVHALGAFKIVVYDLNGNLLNEIEFDFFIYKFTYDSSYDRYVGYAANSLNTQLK